MLVEHKNVLSRSTVGDFVWAGRSGSLAAAGAWQLGASLTFPRYVPRPIDNPHGQLSNLRDVAPLPAPFAHT
jgi:hypothetical protein